MRAVEAIRLIKRIVISVMIGILVSCACSNSVPDQSQTKLHSDGVSLLLAVVDTLLAHNPGWERVSDSLATLPEGVRVAAAEAPASRNRQDLSLQKAIDTLLNSPTYQVYYSHFRNVTPEVHRDMLLHLPFVAIDGPASIANNLLLLCRKRDKVAKWVREVIPKIDMERCRNLATPWLPAGEFTTPEIYFFYDGNGDAFAHQGKVGFDLYGAVFSHQSPGLDNLDSVGADVMEPIIGHELHHIFAVQYVPRATRSNDYQGVLSVVQRGIVSEGIAKQIDGLSPSQKEVFEDSQVVRNWIAQLNERLATVKVDSTQAIAFREWMGRSYHELAMEQLRDHLHRDARRSRIWRRPCDSAPWTGHRWSIR